MNDDVSEKRLTMGNDTVQGGFRQDCLLDDATFDRLAEVDGALSRRFVAFAGNWMDSFCLHLFGREA